MFRFLRAWLYYTWGGLHRFFGNKHSLRKEHEAAVRYFSRAFKIDPSFRRVRLERAVLLWRELDRSADAKNDLDALLDEDPVYGPALLNRAMISQNEGNYAAALGDLERYLQLPESQTGDYREEARRTASLLRDLVESHGGELRTIP